MHWHRFSTEPSSDLESIITKLVYGQSSLKHIFSTWSGVRDVHTHHTESLWKCEYWSKRERERESKKGRVEEKKMRHQIPMPFGIEFIRMKRMCARGADDCWAVIHLWHSQRIFRFRRRCCCCCCPGRCRSRVIGSEFGQHCCYQSKAIYGKKRYNTLWILLHSNCGRFACIIDQYGWLQDFEGTGNQKNWNVYSTA